MGKKVLICTGGTGGHIFPALALAQELEEKKTDYHLAFIGGNLSKNPYFKGTTTSCYDIDCSSFYSWKSWKNIKAIAKILKGFFQSCWYLAKLKPDVVVGFGSFHTFPTLLAAKIMGKKIILHEGNAIPGKVNRLFSPFVKVTGIYFNQAAQKLKGRCVRVGFPLRRGFVPSAISQQEARKELGLSPQLLTILVFGGSQGSLSINNKFIEATLELEEFKKHFQIIHLTGNESFTQEAKKFYSDLHIQGYVVTFEKRMELVWSACDISICRAGAATLAEMIAFEVPSILIPYPRASDGHQLANAQFITQTLQAGVLIEEKDVTGVHLAFTIKQLIRDDKKTLKTMQKKLRDYKMNYKQRDLLSVIGELLGE